LKKSIEIAFDRILSEAIHAKYISDLYEIEKEWKKSIHNSSVRLQWDPDRDPTGNRLERRAIQLGLRGEFLKNYAKDWIVDIEDISDFVREQSPLARSNNWENLLTPKESIYPVLNPETSQKLQLC
jgi:methyl coenzyme M reductase subunit D